MAADEDIIREMKKHIEDSNAVMKSIQEKLASEEHAKEKAEKKHREAMEAYVNIVKLTEAYEKVRRNSESRTQA